MRNGGHGLLERELELSRLHSALAAAASGDGGVAFISGEPGIGKTALLRALIADAPPGTRCVIGRCEPLTTPRALGPFVDAAAALDVGASADRDRLLETLLETVRRGPPTLLAIEDAHWADDATIELLSMLGRRAPDLPLLLVVTHRAGDVGSDHPLRLAIGDLVTAASTEWVALRPLTIDAVTTLAAGAGVDAASLHARTGGNPFFVTEALAAGDELPATVRLAVLARAARLGPAARAVLDAIAIVPGQVEPWLVDAIADAGPESIQTCVDAGVLVLDHTGYMFRHELARLAVWAEMPDAGRRTLHARALATLVERGDIDPARLAHHAIGAGDRAAVAHWSGVACRAASARTAYREAVRHGEQALSAETDPDTIADLQIEMSRALVQVAQAEEAERLAALATGHWKAVGDDRRRADALVALSAAIAAVGNTEASMPPIATAIELLERQAPGPELALAYIRMTSAHMLARERDAAAAWGAKAIALARQLDDPNLLGRALTEAGIADVMDGRFDGLDMVREAVSIGHLHQLPAVVAGGLSQIGSGCGEMRRYQEAIPALEEGIPFATDHHLESGRRYMLAWLARCRFDLGEWEVADELARQALAGRPSLIARFVGLNTLGWIRARSGDEDGGTMLDEAGAIAARIAHLQRLWPNAVARAEAAWLDGNIDAHVDLLRSVLALAIRCRHSLAIGEVALWLHRAGAIDAAPEGAADPFAAWISGRPMAAATGFRSLGQPYETAWALWDTGDRVSVTEALAAFDRLGARPMADRVAASIGSARRERRGDERPSRPAGSLSERELEVMRLVAAGYSNPQIASTLFISRKTAEHHVSNILMKLGASTRAEAATIAVRSGLLSDR